MTIHCYFKFVRATPIFYSGDQICGVVNVITTKRLKIETINLRLVGLYQVQWKQKLWCNSNVAQGDDMLNIEEQLYYKCKTLLNENVLLLEKTVLPAGSYNYEFEFTIPQNSAPTFKETFGEVAYNVELMIERIGKHCKIFKERVVVKQVLNLNEICTYPFEKEISFDEHRLKLNLPQTAYVPGQQIRYYLEYLSLPVSELHIQVNLMQNITFNSLDVTVKNKQIIKLIASNNYSVNGNKQLLFPPLTIPTSTLDNDWPIKISYYLETLILNQSSLIVHKLMTPILIGTVSLTKLNGFCMENELTESYCFDNLGAVFMETDNKNINYNNKQHNLLAT